MTHYPRYQIDMELKQGETIFDKMGIAYDELRSMENPVVPVSKYYKSKLKSGESLWWANDEADNTAPPTVKLWTSLSAERKEFYAIQGYVLFPEIVSNRATKYNRYALWLATQQGIVNTNIRDSFSAGGKVYLQTSKGLVVKMPAAFGRIKKYKEYIVTTINNLEEEVLKNSWQVKHIGSNRIQQWIDLISLNANVTVGNETAKSVLEKIFSEI
ncbi:MAG: hypothetical protein IJ676_04410 [Clostridia bacterium]|nr:hypothetical protein [Clostridia bacterium]